MQHTPDGRYVIVDGRRWRATDPRIPQRLQAELVAELMAARRGVADGGSRARVQDAKVALGERGEPWWDEPTPQGLDERLAAAIRALLRHRRSESSICPSDAARIAAGSRWRQALPNARSVAAGLRRDGVVRVTQRGADVDPAGTRGPLRIAHGPNWPG